MLAKVYLSILLSVCYFAKSCVHAASCSRPNRPFTRQPLTLCQEFQLIRDLAPRESLISLVQSHMQTDRRFRMAVQFMVSAEFKEIVTGLDATTAFQSLLSEFKDVGVNTTDIDSIGKIFDCILIPIINEATSQRRSFSPAADFAQSRSLEEFSRTVVRLIPTDKFVDVIKTQIAENRNFADFYTIVRNPTFRTNVMSSFINSDVSRYIKRLRRRQIYLSKMAEAAFNLLYLGPSP